MRHPQFLASTFLAAVLVGLALSSSAADAHQNGCHRWHSCPSDTGSYVCGDLGYTTYCPPGGIATPPPADSDGDGVIDPLDGCPTVFALTMNGCPVVAASPPRPVPAPAPVVLTPPPTPVPAPAPVAPTPPPVSSTPSGSGDKQFVDRAEAIAESKSYARRRLKGSSVATMCIRQDPATFTCRVRYLRRGKVQHRSTVVYAEHDRLFVRSI